MSTKDFTANVISATPIVPDGNFKNSKASGIWDINEALDLIKGGNWPNAANFPPESFVDGLFSTYLYDGNGGTQTITNDINLSDSGGLVWSKRRESTSNSDHTLYDTERGTGTSGRLRSNNNQQAYSPSDAVTAFNNNGFSLGADASINTNGAEYVSWTFRKQPKFFDVVKWTGDGTTDRSISHNLGQVPGMIIAKKISGSGDWHVLHRSVTMSGTGNSSTGGLKLNATGASTYYTHQWEHTYPEATLFKVSHVSGASAQTLNTSSETYIAYLFAHNNDDGGFGEPGDQDIIKCGTYTGNGSSTGTVVTLGFEPQFIMLKRTNDTGNANWYVFDSMRGIVTGGDDPYLYWNTDAAEVAGNALEVTPTGFQLKATGTGFNGSSDTYIYVAIRRGGMQTPTAASDVFAIDDQGESSAPYSISGFPVDMVLRKDTDGSRSEIMTRLTQGKLLVASATDAEDSDSVAQFDFNNGCLDGTSQDTTKFSWMWKRARGYFDVVVYSGPDSTGNISHNLGVVPEMIWVKNAGATENWAVYHKDLGNTYYLHLNTDAAASNTDGGNFWNSTTPTASVFSVGTSTLTSHYTRKHVAYLFATAAGVSKVGSYTGNGSSQNIDCGFSGGTGARFVLIKNADATGSWVIFDTTRGLVAGNDNYLRLDVTNAQGGGYDFIDPLESGFTINQTGGVVLNESGETYIFYAIA